MPVSAPRIAVEPIELFPSWEAALLPVSGFPMNADAIKSIEPFLQRLARLAMKQHGLSHEVVVQLWSMTPQTGGTVLAAHTDRWLPDFGLGIWPDRRPPQGWTEEMLMDAAASVFTGEEPERPSHRLLRLAGPAIREEAAHAMRGFGSQFEMFSRHSYEEIIKRSRALYLPTIVEPRFRREPFYLPLFSRAGLRAAGTAEQLQIWMCGIEFYVRESAEDKGILIVSSFPLGPLFEEAREP